MLTIPNLQGLWNQRQFQVWGRLVSQIEKLGGPISSLSNAELLKQSLALRYEAESGVSLDRLLPQAFALMREASDRSLNMRHYRVQLLGGIALHHGGVAIMQTGEGKTLTATLPMYLASLLGNGAHLATANDYLAARDAELMRPAYELLGVSIGVVTSESSPKQRRDAYAADITYSTAKEIGFDFLRDRLAKRQHQGPPGLPVDGTASGNTSVQRDFSFALVDEADSILIDEARTPLIVSSAPDQLENPDGEIYRWAYKNTPTFHPETHFIPLDEHRQVELTGEGRKLVRTLTKPTALNAVPMLDLYEFVERAIAVERNYQKHRHYVVRDDEVQIVDEFTGRIAEGRKWRSGLHQAIEAREGLKISQETGEAARITIQDLFLRYQRLAGMTGTVASSGPELRKIYGLSPIEIPTNRPPQRQQLPSRSFATAEEKWQAIAEEIEQLHGTGRPVLIGTRSIDLSERLSDLLRQRGIVHRVLNAKRIAEEAEIVAQAGQVGKVTVATNMAGRGTDIRLSDEALQLGGLHVICSELHESARIDRQLIGRCGRQGDPGSFRHFYCLEDDIVSAGFSSDLQQKMVQQFINQRHSHPPTNLFHRAQGRIERNHFKLRKQLLFHESQRQQLQREMGQDPYLDTIE